MKNKIALVNGSWAPDSNNKTDWVLTVVPVIQVYSDSNSTRYLPAGRMSLVSLTESVDINNALGDYTYLNVSNSVSMKQSNVFEPVFNNDGKVTVHNLGTVSDEIESYDVYLVIPTNLTMTIKNRCFTWDGMYYLDDINPDDDFDDNQIIEKQVYELLKQVKFKSISLYK